jgi:uncharacterized protein (DUF58 family)
MIDTDFLFTHVANIDKHGQAKLAGGKIYIIPTRAGLVFAIGLTAMLLGSLNYGSNIGLAFTFLFGSIAMVGMIYTWRNLLDLRIETVDAAPIFVEQPTSFTVRLSDTRGLERASITVATVDKIDAPAVDISALGNADVELYPTPQHRGKYNLGKLVISSTYPLGIFYAWGYANTTASVIVYPAPTKAQHWRPTVRFVPALRGGARGVGVEDFIGLRPYRIGDSLKHLDWKALARERGLVTRQFGGDRQEEIWLDWNAVGPGTTEERLSRLCRLVLDAISLHLSFGLKLPNDVVPSAAGDAHKHYCLTKLALFPNVITLD